MQSPQCCSHGCYLPSGESTPRDLNGLAYCTGCECQGGAFVLADGHVHGFERTPIYDDRNYFDVTGNEGWYKASRYPAQPVLESVAEVVKEFDTPRATLTKCLHGIYGSSTCAICIALSVTSPTTRLDGWNEPLFVVETNVAPKMKTAPVEVEEKIKVPAEWRGPWQPKPCGFLPWVAPSFDVMPLGLYPTNRSQAGYTGENGTSRRECAKPLTNFCSRCFTRGSITEHIEGGFVPERGWLVRKVMSEDAPGDWFFHVRGEKLDNRWVKNRVFTRQEIRYGLHVPQIHACGERAEA